MRPGYQISYPQFFPLRLITLCLFFLAASSTYSQPKLSWNFSQGSLGSWELQDGNRISLQLLPQSSPWFFFRVDNAPNQHLQFVIENAPTELFESFFLPVISYDQTNWSSIKDVMMVPNSEANHANISFEISMAEERAWVAYAPPYPNTKLDEWLSTLTDNPHVQIDSLLETPQKELSFPLITITDTDVPDDTKNRIWILSREGGNESASTWVSIGALQFLLSNNPIAEAIKRRGIISFLPIMDRDAAESGVNWHPLDATTTVNWKTTWNEKNYSFYEQRTVKHHLQTIKDSSRSIQLCIRLQSSQYGQDLLYRDPIQKEKEAAQDQLVLELLGKKYLPSYSSVERQAVSGTFSEPLRMLFPDVIPITLSTGYAYNSQFGYEFPIPKSTDDLLTEGELLMYAIAEAMQVPASEMPPHLYAAEVYRMDGNNNQSYHVRCIYRDIQNLPPESVQIVINDQPFDLQPADANKQDYNNGVLYTGFIQSNSRMNTHYFTASNGTQTVRVPQQGTRPGPYSVPIKKR